MKEKRAALRTKRLRITAMTDAELAQKIASETDEHLRSAYAEMLALSQAEPAERLFATAWRIERRDTGETIGDLCFKGKPNECGEVEIGYGVAPVFQGQGYASEAVQAALNWAFSDNRVYFVLADAEPGNAASKRVLEKLKFSPAGERNGLSLYEKEKRRRRPICRSDCASALRSARASASRFKAPRQGSASAWASACASAARLMRRTRKNALN